MNKLPKEMIEDRSITGNQIAEKTITKENLADNAVVVDSAMSSTSTNPVQNKVVTGKIAEVEESVATAQETADAALPKSGGIITGHIYLDNVGIRSARNDTGVHIYGGSIWGEGANITLYGADHPTTPGVAHYVATTQSKDTKYSYLTHKPDGSLTLDDKNIVRSVDDVAATADGNVPLNALKTTGGTMTGDITFTGVYAHIWKADTTSGMVVCGGPDETKGARFVAMGCDRPDRLGGMFECVACSSPTESVSLLGYTDEVLTWAGRNIVRSVNGTNADAAGNVYTNGPINSRENVPHGNWKIADLTSLDQDTWYPVIYYQHSCPDLHIKAREWAWSGAGRPSWSTHSTGGFSAYLEATSYGSGWGIWGDYQFVTQRYYAHCALPPIPGVGQLRNTSRSYIWLRGGAKYALWCNQWTANDVNSYPVIITTSSTWSDQTIAPVTSCPTEVSSGKTGYYMRPAVLCDAYNNGTSWYRVYADGLVVQGGIISSLSHASPKTVSLPRAFSGTNYCVQCGLVTAGGSFGDDVCANVTSRSTSSFVVYPYDQGGSGGTATGCFIAMGY